METKRLVSGYEIKGYDIKLYCKITEENVNTDNYTCVMSFGSGMKNFCLTAIYSIKKPSEIYIDRVEKNDLCTINGKLGDYDNGTVKLVKVALWTMKKLYPHVEKYTLKDNSQIYCDNINKKFKMSMSYDYIIKYNKTWYEKHFNAELPEMLKDAYTDSLKSLDDALLSFQSICNEFSVLKKYKDIYEVSVSPRDFVNKIRKQFGDGYCFEVGRWLNQYIEFLQIKLAADFWYIPHKSILSLSNYTATKLTNVRAIELLNSNMFGCKNKHQTIGITSRKRFRDMVVDTYNNSL